MVKPSERNCSNHLAKFTSQAITTVTFFYPQRQWLQSEPKPPKTIAANDQVEQVTNREEFPSQRYVPVFGCFYQTRSTYFLERRLFL